jgi:hypothetical protein
VLPYEDAEVDALRRLRSAAAPHFIREPLDRAFLIQCYEACGRDEESTRALLLQCAGAPEGP